MQSIPFVVERAAEPQDSHTYNIIYNAAFFKVFFDGRAAKDGFSSHLPDPIRLSCRKKVLFFLPAQCNMVSGRRSVPERPGCAFHGGMS